MTLDPALSRPCSISTLLYPDCNPKHYRNLNLNPTANLSLGYNPKSTPNPSVALFILFIERLALVLVLNLTHACTSAACFNKCKKQVGTSLGLARILT